MSAEERTLHAEMEARYVAWLNSKTAAIAEYIAACDYPEVFDDDEESEDVIDE